MALYLCRAEPAPTNVATNSEVDALEYTASLAPWQTVPDNKVIINLLSDGTYTGELGEIENSVQGDFATGRLDRSVPTEVLQLDPQPTHAKWEYFENGITKGQEVVPEFHCLMLRSEWRVVDVDRERGIYQQVAFLEFGDNPNHRF